MSDDFDLLETNSQEKNEKNKHVYRFFYLDDGSVHIFNYYKHFIFENVESIFEYKCSKYYLGDITVKNYNGRIKGAIKSCFKDESWGQDFNNQTTKKFKNKIKYTNDSCVEILPEGIGLFFVLSTFLSKSLSAISLNIQPALRINTEPTKNKIIYFTNSPNSLV